MPKGLVSQKNSGNISMVSLVFIVVFVTVLGGLAALTSTQRRVQEGKEIGERALQIAEAGLDYYKWFLAHYPGDVQDGTGGPGPYVHVYNDPEGGAVGEFSLEVSGKYQCGILSTVTINSTGYTYAKPEIKKTVIGQYGRPSIGEYSYILNSDVWAGSDRVIYGPYHSNGGIRMDGTNYAQVTSAKTTWNCTTSYGCNPANPNAPGVVGNGSGSALWAWPVPLIDFASVTLDLAEMKNRTASTTPGVCAAGQTYGCYFGPSGGGGRGYHAVFLNDGRMELYTVTAVRSSWEYNIVSGWQQENNTIIAEAPVAGSPFTLPADCRVVFVEDKLWVDGTVKNKVSIAAANLGATDPDLILSGNIDYTTLNGGDGLLAIGENRVLVPLDSPDNMLARGVFVAQKGYFGRHCFRQTPAPENAGCGPSGACNNFANNWCRVPNSQPVPGITFCGSSYRNCVKRNSMQIYGTIVSSGRVGTKWSCGGSYCSGYNTRTDSYDSKLAGDPPPLTPYISSQYKFLDWTQTR